MTYVERVCHRILGNSRGEKMSSIERMAKSLLEHDNPEAYLDFLIKSRDRHTELMARYILSEARARELHDNYVPPV